MMEAGDRETLAWIDEAAGFQWLVHPYQLRHGCGYKLPNGGGDIRALQRYLGHRNIPAPDALYPRERGLMRPSHAVSLDLSRTKPC